MRGEEGALQTHARESVREQNDRKLAIGHVGVASGGVLEHGRNVGGEQVLDGFGHEVAHVVRLGARRSGRGRVPDLHLIAGGQLQRGHANGELAWFGVRGGQSDRVDRGGGCLGGRGLGRGWLGDSGRLGGGRLVG